MAGTLFVVATPIGNLEDVTLRSLRVLREVNLIAAEDTRRTGRLLAHYGIASSTLSFHQHNVRSRLPRLISRLEAGDSVAVVTDAGTPGISDPGVELVQACLDAGIAVDPIPGANAPFTAAVVSGFPIIPLTILGFPPRRAKDRKGWISLLSRITHTTTFFESPLRVSKTLNELSIYLGIRQICLARELSKVHQEFLRGTAAEVSEKVLGKKGEMTVVIGPEEARAIRPTSQSQEVSPAVAAECFGRMIGTGSASRREALTRTAKELGRPVREIYALIEEARKFGL